jgi:hypothetical protein
MWGHFYSKLHILYPIIEARGEIMPDGTSLYVLPAIKFRIQENQTIGTGFQQMTGNMMLKQYYNMELNFKKINNGKLLLKIEL